MGKLVQQTLFKRKICIINEHVRHLWSITNLIIRQLQTKMKLRFYITTMRMFIINKKEQSLLTVYRGKKLLKTKEITIKSSEKAKNQYILFLEIYLKKSKSIYNGDIFIVKQFPVPCLGIHIGVNQWIKR